MAQALLNLMDINGMTAIQHAVFKQLEALFPNHDANTIQRVIRSYTKPEFDASVVMQRCIDRLINMVPAVGTLSTGEKKKSTSLSPIQKEVMSHLSVIFPKHSSKAIKISVCHPSNLFEPLASHTLIQRCIDDLLEGRTALEVSDYCDEGQVQVVDGEHEDDVSIHFVEETKDVLITGVEKLRDPPVTLLDSDDDEVAMCEIAETVEMNAWSTSNLKHKTSASQLACPHLHSGSEHKASADILYTSLPSFKRRKEEVVPPTCITSLESSREVPTKVSYCAFKSEPNLTNSSFTASMSLSDVPNSSFTASKPLSNVANSSFTASKHLSNVANSSSALAQSVLSSSPTLSLITTVTTASCSANSSSILTTQAFAAPQIASTSATATTNVNKAAEMDVFSSTTINFSDTDSGNSMDSDILLSGLELEEELPHITFIPKIRENDSPRRSGYQEQRNDLNVTASAGLPAKLPPMLTQFPETKTSNSVTSVSAMPVTSLALSGFSNPGLTAPSVVLQGTKVDYGRDQIRNMNKTGNPHHKQQWVPLNPVHNKMPVLPRPQTHILTTTMTPQSTFPRPPQSATGSNTTVTIKSKHRITYNNSQSVNNVMRPGMGNHVGGGDPVPTVTFNFPYTAIDGADIEMVDEIPRRDAARNKVPSYLLPPVPAPPALRAAPEPAIQPKPAPPSVKSAEDMRIEVKNDVLSLFPDLDPTYLDTLTYQYVGPMAVNNICNILLENPYPKISSKPSSSSTESAAATTATMVSSVDYFKDYKSIQIPGDMCVKYQSQAFTLLSQEFRWFPANDIRKINAMFSWYYAPTYQALGSIWEQAKAKVATLGTSPSSKLKLSGLVFTAQFESESGSKAMSMHLLKSLRPVAKSKLCVVPELQREIDFIKCKLAENAKEEDHQVAVQLNEQEYEDEGQCIECGCCYGEYPFENMVQCYEGHLFCENCLRQYAKESIFGQGKADLQCMTDTCDSSFPKSQLEKALSSDILSKYDDRVLEENLNLADIGDLVRCPHCDFAAIMDPGDKVFRCQSDPCKRDDFYMLDLEQETCRYCKEDWVEHFGKKCEELEKKDETKLRLDYEEKMTQAKVRMCHRCKAQFCKEDGCNKMTCRCGTKMCYICRKPNIDYNHFCRHPRDPGSDCKTCKACSLWSNADEDDNRAVREIQREAEETRKNKGFLDEKLIGAPDLLPPTKKMKT